MTFRVLNDQQKVQMKEKMRSSLNKNTGNSFDVHPSQGRFLLAKASDPYNFLF